MARAPPQNQSPRAGVSGRPRERSGLRRGFLHSRDYGYIYSRIGNPTTSTFEERIATLEGGTYAQFDITLRKLGIDAVFVDPSRPENFRAAGHGGCLPQAGGDFRRGG